MLTGPYGSGSIYVVCNYRLNVLGYLSMRELFNEDPSMATSGNYGALACLLLLPAYFSASVP